MKEDNKYYTPEISELFVGYEYERMNGEDWEEAELSEIDLCTESSGGEPVENEFEEIVKGLRTIRTPYLTKGQIESDGWNFISNDLGFPEYYRKGSFHIIPREKGIYEIIKVDFKNTEEFSKSKPTYIGNIKSINELRKIQIWLGII